MFWLPHGPSGFVTASPVDREILSFVKTLPEDVLIAGEPCWLSSVPILTGHKVLWSCEHIGNETTINDTLEAYYAETLTEVSDFCATYDVDYMVIDPKLFAEESIHSDRFFFEPYTTALRSSIGSRTSFAMKQAGDIPGAVGSGDIFIIPCSDGGLMEASDPGDDRPQVKINASLDDGVYLDGYDVLSLDVNSGGGIVITLHWRAEAIPSTDYMVFVQLVDWSISEVVAQSDRYPAQGRRPTSTWRVGDTILDTHYFTLPETLPKGNYELIAGMYRLDTMERLNVTGEDRDYIRLAGPFLDSGF